MNREDETKQRIAESVSAGELGPGRPIGLLVHQRLERMLGRSLPDARVHETEEAALMTDALDARAFTVGTDIFAPASALRQEFAAGRGLLAHELVHAAQSSPPLKGDLSSHTRTVQSDGVMARTALRSRAAQHESHFEAEAAAAEAVAGGIDQSRDQHEESTPAPDPELVADRVYRLMVEESQLFRERKAMRR
jgi:hypothetical protein